MNARHFALAIALLATSAYAQPGPGPQPLPGCVAGVACQAASLSVPAATSASATTGSLSAGTLSFSDTGLGLSLQGNLNSYVQSIIQNTNAGAAASASYVVANDQGTATTHFGEFGINSSSYTGTGNLNLAGATYLSSTTGDLVLGTTTSNAIHFLVNNGATDAATIGTGGGLTLNNDLTYGGITLSNAVTGTGNMVLATSPTFTTPTMGVAAATSLAINGCTIGTNALCTSGNITANSGNVVAAFGVVAGSGVYPSGSGKSQIVANADGAISFGNSANTNTTTISFPTATATPTLQLGAADAASPVAQTVIAQSVVAGTSNTNGTNLTIAGSKGTGTGTGGSLIFQVSPAGTTGTAQNALATALTIDSTKFATFGAGATFTGSLSFGGTLKPFGTIPTVSGTGTPTITTGSTDNAGEVTAGTSATSVVITFASVKTNAPFCTVTDQSQLTSFAYTISTSAITITQTATTGNKIDYVCIQH